MQMLKLGPGILRGHVQNKEEETAALDVTQKREAQAAVEMGPSDDTWDVSNCTEGRQNMLNICSLLYDKLIYFS